MAGVPEARHRLADRRHLVVHGDGVQAELIPLPGRRVHHLLADEPQRPPQAEGHRGGHCVAAAVGVTDAGPAVLDPHPAVQGRVVIPGEGTESKQVGEVHGAVPDPVVVVEADHVGLRQIVEGRAHGAPETDEGGVGGIPAVKVLHVPVATGDPGAAVAVQMVAPDATIAPQRLGQGLGGFRSVVHVIALVQQIHHQLEAVALQDRQAPGLVAGQDCVEAAGGDHLHDRLEGRGLLGQEVAAVTQGEDNGEVAGLPGRRLGRRRRGCPAEAGDGRGREGRHAEQRREADRSAGGAHAATLAAAAASR